MLTIQITNIRELKASLTGLQNEQLPFVTALALTKTAQDAQQELRKVELPEKFTLRRRGWMQQNIRVEPAKKNNLVARVYDTYAAMGLQETGGTKIPYRQFIAVPLSGARPKPTAIPSPLPHEVMAMGGFIRGNIMFLQAYKGIAGPRPLTQAQFLRDRRARLGLTAHAAGSLSREIIPMYALVSKAKIPARYGFEATVQRIVKANFAANFRAAWQQAAKTARK